MSKPKSKVSYPAGMRPEAKQERKGLWTVSMVMPNGALLEAQGFASDEQVQFLKWVAVVMARPDARPPGGLEEIVRKVVER